MKVFSVVQSPRRRRLIAAVAVSAAAVLWGLALTRPVSASNVPTVYPVQGVLAQGSGEAVDGVHDVSFELYAEAAGGVPLFGELHENLVVEQGAFLAYLGAGLPVGAPLSGTLFEENPDLWLQVAVDGEVIAPRFRYGAVPYATLADKAQFADQAASALSAETAVTATTAGDAAQLGGKSPSEYQYTAGTGLSLSAGRQFSVVSGGITSGMLASGLSLSGTTTLASGAVTGDFAVNGKALVGYEHVTCANATSCSCPTGKVLLGGSATGHTTNVLFARERFPYATSYKSTTTFEAMCASDDGTCGAIKIACARLGG